MKREATKGGWPPASAAVWLSAGILLLVFFIADVTWCELNRYNAIAGSLGLLMLMPMADFLWARMGERRGMAASRLPPVRRP